MCSNSDYNYYKFYFVPCLRFYYIFFKTKSTVIFKRKQTNRFSYFRQKSSIWSFSEGKIYTIHWNEGIQFSRACASTNIVFSSNLRIMLSNAQKKWIAKRKLYRTSLLQVDPTKITMHVLLFKERYRFSRRCIVVQTWKGFKATNQSYLT